MYNFVDPKRSASSKKGEAKRRRDQRGRYTQTTNGDPISGDVDVLLDEDQRGNFLFDRAVESVVGEIKKLRKEDIIKMKRVSTDRIARVLVGEEQLSSHERAYSIMKAWANDSSNWISSGLQIAAAKKFGSFIDKYTSIRADHILSSSNLFPYTPEELEEVVDVMYKRTQELFGVEGNIILYRGVKGAGRSFRVGEVVELETSPLSSWSLSPDIAKSFSNNGYVLKAKIPTFRLVSSAMSGLGTVREKELIVFSMRGDTARVVSVGTNPVN